MNPLNKKEAIGIFVSIAIMALSLSFIRFNTEVFSLNEQDIDSQKASVIAVTELSQEGQNLEGTLKGASNSKGELVDLVIEDVRLGNGATVKDGDELVVHYIGATQEGVRFDSSYERGEPFIFTVGAGKVIEGWEEGLVGMRVGGQRVLVIPSDMAYGNMQVGVIPANSPLIFAVELLELK